VKQRLLDCLRCPFCWGELKASCRQRGEELISGILDCHCSRYPVIAGIPILQKEPSRVLAELIRRIEAGLETEALLFAVSPFAVPPPSSRELGWPWIQFIPSVRGVNRLKHVAYSWRLRRWETQAKHLLIDKSETTATHLLKFFLGSNKDAFDYFAFRFGQPRHLVALSFASIIQKPGKPILDLACGYGHITRNLLGRAKGQPVIGIDPNFLGLYIAKTFIAPDAEYMCCATDGPLPFADGYFSAAFCSDAFHYFQNKAATIRELKRLTQHDGVIILTWVHNMYLRLPHDGTPLPPHGYQALVSDMRNRLIADSDVLLRYRQKQGPALAQQCDPNRLACEPLLSIVASHNQEVFKDYGCFEGWPHAEGRLEFNPLYTFKNGRESNGQLHLRRTFPSEFYEKDHIQCNEYLPETVTLPSAILADLAEGRQTSQVQKLIDQCIVLDIPDRYV
jgi:SAM-dependent methyltransferase/uncharacterized protein YbaR (Trm112 family)